MTNTFKLHICNFVSTRAHAQQSRGCQRNARKVYDQNNLKPLNKLRADLWSRRIWLSLILTLWFHHWWRFHPHQLSGLL